MAVQVGARRAFVAQHPGACGSCATTVEPGDLLFNVPGNETPSGLDCCGDRPDEDLTVLQRSDEGLSVDEDPQAAIARVLPRGKTGRDACPKCWL
ncbi:hypothetical protein ABZS66_19105 [Dactylosporangium sp. NPDC005572]|uniref:hypothetical protein n=1 Tax=Dactylosporangium sp. NPDC005572 TaxID=3156889 RepID=UPI0033B67718